ncbi:MAG: ABC transporter ATP-binding protein [Chloroflexi bacterium]|jgi:ABC-2 type transport system ATP-binding protein|nr:ABC transporter ATP-binding protein [Anaerolineaceae bacterium]NMB89967.1 ABC transporter ATP-binding protein [Chloroflexota bacterium]
MRYRVIRTENLTKRYRNQFAVKDLTLEVEPGEVYGLLGASGAGKTTALLMLMDYIRPTDGRAYVFNLDSHRNSLQIRKQVGFLPERFSFFPHLNGEEMLAYLGRLRGQVDWPYAHQLAERLDLDLARPVLHMNGEERCKLGLVQAFMHRPELVLLDEPACQLSPEARKAFYCLVGNVRQEGRSVFVATHSLGEVERICDRVAVLHEGQLLAVERAIQLRSRALRRVEMRFAGPVSAEAFAGLTNLQDLRLEENALFCTVRGDPKPLLNTASQYRMVDYVCQTPSLEELVGKYYGAGSYAS